MKFNLISGYKMPAAKSNKKGGRKTNYRRKNRGGYTSVTKQTARPQRMLAKLVYFDSGQLANSVGVFQSQAFNLNSIYDPDRSGIGTQPLGRDQWAIWYNRYRVYRVDYIVTLTNLDPDQAANVALVNANGIPTFTDNAVYEQPGAFHKQLSPRDGGLSRLEIKNSVFLPRLNGKTSQSYSANDDTQAQMGANPAEILTQTIVCSPVIPGSEINVGWSVKYVYHVEMFDPNTLSKS